ncbi:hypothetical protein BV378_11145 [Nostoc sp. RF31YmG]|nr:hypothetical protein BV378_11145 [Nostoc sp. RF31YmG]
MPDAPCPIANRPALKIEAETTQNRSKIIFIIPCARRSWSLLQKYIFARGGKGKRLKGKGFEFLSPFPLSLLPTSARSLITNLDF